MSTPSPHAASSAQVNVASNTPEAASRPRLRDSLIE